MLKPTAFSKMVWHVSVGRSIYDRRLNSQEQDKGSQVEIFNLTLTGQKERRTKIRVLRTSHLIVRLEFAPFPFPRFPLS